MMPAIPSFFEFIHPLLSVLAEHDGEVRASAAYEATADRVGLSDEQRGELLPSGQQPVYKNRIGWAHDRLKRAGLSSSPRRGIWVLTAPGRAYAVRHKNGVPDAELSRLAYPPRSSRLRGEAEGEETSAAAPPPPTVQPKSPYERIDEAILEIHDSVAEELLDLIGGASPTFFEGLVLELLHRMGYGTSREALQRVGGSGDGGIDGIISLDKLGLEKVYVQAKRWQGSVGRPDIQAFLGALMGRRARKGVFITTSAFTREAREFAAQNDDTLVLVDGAGLTRLMIDHEVGVSARRIVKVSQVDSDFFEEG
jgi:restriction system protein